MGYVGVNDGWRQVRAAGRLTDLYTEARDGNIALSAEVRLGERRREGDDALVSEFVIALAFGGGPAEAAAVLVTSTDHARRLGIDLTDHAAMTPAASVSGLYPSASAGVSFDFARHLPAFFHGGRLALGVSGGLMPTSVGGQQRNARWYGTAGGSLTLGFGANR